MNKKVEMLARDILIDYIKINIGNIHLGNKDVRQIIEVLKTEELKWQWLTKRLNEFVKVGLVLIFCSSKKKVEVLKRHIVNENKIPCGIIHGDKLQYDRESTIKKFKELKYKVLVSTDVLARGLDISQIKTVINYDCAYNMDAHIHRIGRTGRAGSQDGIAYTLLTPMGDKDRYMAPQFVTSFKQLGLPISMELKQLAGVSVDLNSSILLGDESKINGDNDNSNSNDNSGGSGGSVCSAAQKLSGGILKHGTGSGTSSQGNYKRGSGGKHVQFGQFGRGGGSKGSRSHQLSAQKKKEFQKHGFKVGNTNSIAMSFAKTFTKGSTSLNESDSNNNHNNNKGAATSGNVPTQRRRKSRFADKS